MASARLLPLACALALLAACSEPTGGEPDGAGPQVGLVRVSVHAATMGTNDSLSLTAIVYDTSGGRMTGADVRWASSDTAIARVRRIPVPDGSSASSAAMVSFGSRWGSVRVSAEAGGFGDTCAFTVLLAGIHTVSGETPAAVGRVGSVIEARVRLYVCTGECLTFRHDPRASRVYPPQAEPGVTMTWSVVDGGGHVEPETTLTDAIGYAATTWTLGAAPGPQRIAVSAVGTGSGTDVWAYSVSDTAEQVAFAKASGDGGGTDIYLLRFADRTELRLTSATGVDDGPSWSPGGDRIAFVSSRDGNRELYVMQADGSAPTRLTYTPEQEESPAWSPDGSWIAVGSDSGRVRLVAPDGSRDTAISGPGGHYSQPSWAPDGARLAVVNRIDSLGQTIYRVEALWLDGSHMPIATPAPSGASGTQIRSIAWSPDGTRIAYSEIQWWFNPLGWPPTTYAHYIVFVTPEGASSGWTSGAAPDWSPDGNLLAFLAVGGGWETKGTLSIGAADGSWRVTQMQSIGTVVGPPRWRPRPH